MKLVILRQKGKMSKLESGREEEDMRKLDNKMRHYRL